MDSFDFSILSFLNDFSRQSQIFDRLMLFASGNHFVKGGVAVSFLWWAWFQTQHHMKGCDRTRTVSDHPG